tara:strand:- start:435 stop:1010 length:576 start_codon:yes stop_codon:yes gene_type:complete
MIRKIKTENNKCTFEIYHKNPYMCFNTANSIRRALISDVETYAPYNVLIKTNTSCQPDEYIAHRIGLIPFLKTNKYEENDTMKINVSEKVVTAEDIQGNSFTTIHKKSPIIKLIKNQTLDLEILFNKGTGAKHARYSPTAGVGFEIKSDNTISFSFESINGENPCKHLLTALEHIVTRIHNVKYQIEKINS